MEANKFQWMVFSPDRLQQWVVRADTEEDFIEGILLVQNLVCDTLLEHVKEKNAVEGTVSEQEPEVQADQCPIHNKPMKQRTSKNGGHYYDHRWQVDNVWHVCNGSSVRVQTPKTTPF